MEVKTLLLIMVSRPQSVLHPGVNACKYTRSTQTFYEAMKTSNLVHVAIQDCPGTSAFNMAGRLQISNFND